MSTASPSVIQQEIEQLVVEIEQNLTNNYVAMSAISFLFYDVLINMDREIEYIWKARWSISKVLFIIGRYYGLCYLIANFAVSTTIGLSSEFCKVWYWYDIMAGDIFFTSIVNAILIMRLYAMYRNRKVLTFFILLFIGEFVFELYASITLSIESYRSVVTIPDGIPLSGCYTNPNVKIALFAWVPCMVVATSFFVMTVAKVLFDGYTTSGKLLEIKHISPLIVSMVRDGALYYSLMFGILLATILLLEVSRGIIIAVTMQWLVVIYSLAASRLVLNLREEGSRSHIEFKGSQTTGPPMFAMTPIERTSRGAESSTRPFSPARSGDV